VAPKAPGEGFVPQTPHHRPTAKRIRDFAKKMRREPPDAEARIWTLLRDHRLANFKFRRQVPFQNFILDVVCFKPRLLIEIDGSQHTSSDRDAARDTALTAEGFQVARDWNNDVLRRPWLYWRASLQSSPTGERPLSRRLTS
jgi:very-short-patch-repair endonuclease